MSGLTSALTLFLAAALVIPAIVAFRRPLGKLLRLAGKTGVCVALLALFQNVGSFLGLALGVNLPNALVLALLGLPGAGLLCLLHWVTLL